ncbi:Enoyl-CoA-hydratase [Paraconexibacter sp. AEG42_29]|uniref:Enoyl-CoA-hydratase n=1 Tax=Paraconexibacter sp. AEG42_29 TaxID=2997339 RepID=A0AAU7B3L6_9ACTN
MKAPDEEVPVRFSVEDGVALITLNRPARRNAIDLATAIALGDCLDELDARDDLVVGVITGEGGTFSAGMDLKALAATGQRPIVEGRGAFGVCERSADKPLVAAVEGHALGGGFEIALACDLIVAAESATFGLPEVTRGLAAAAGGAIRLPQRIPYGHAMELILTGAPLSAERAHALGLVNHLTEAGGALEAALALARRIAVNAPLAVKMSKLVVRAAQGVTVAEAFAAQAPLMNVIRASDDAREGAQAFVEKRAPVWSGR